MKDKLKVPNKEILRDMKELNNGIAKRIDELDSIEVKGDLDGCIRKERLNLKIKLGKVVFRK